MSHCKTFLDYVKDRDGFWLVTTFSSPDSWEEFARVESCVVAVRHTDRATGTIPYVVSCSLSPTSSLVSRVWITACSSRFAD